MFFFNGNISVIVLANRFICVPTSVRSLAKIKIETKIKDNYRGYVHIVFQMKFYFACISGVRGLLTFHVFLIIKLLRSLGTD